jgi:hypothetical protein
MLSWIRALPFDQDLHSSNIGVEFFTAAESLQAMGREQPVLDYLTLRPLARK